MCTKQHVKIIIATILQMTVGPSLIVVNSGILKGGFPYPIMLASTGVITSAVLAHVLVYLGYAEVSEASQNLVAGNSYYYKIFPIGFCQMVTFWGGNACYIYMDMSLVQIMKSFTPVSILIVLVLFKLETLTFPVVMSVTIVVIGVLMSVANVAVTPTPTAAFVFMISDISEALRLGFTQKLMTAGKLSLVEGQYFIGPTVATFLIIAGAIMELPQAVSSGHFAYICQEPLQFVVAACLGTMINFMSLFIMNVLGSMSLKFLGIFRACGLVAFDVVARGKIVTAWQAMGYVVATVGTLLHYYIKLYGEATPRSMKVIQHNTGRSNPEQAW